MFCFSSLIYSSFICRANPQSRRYFVSITSIAKNLPNIIRKEEQRQGEIFGHVTVEVLKFFIQSWTTAHWFFLLPEIASRYFNCISWCDVLAAIISVWRFILHVVDVVDRFHHLWNCRAINTTFFYRNFLHISRDKLINFSNGDYDHAFQSGTGFRCKKKRQT